MPVPTAYTEDELAAYMHSALRDVATAMGWSVAGGDYDEPVIDTLLAYGEDDIADATDMKKLRALAMVAVWQAVVDATVGDYDFSADGGSYSRAQLHDHAVARLTQAQTDAAAYLDVMEAGLVTITHTNDPWADYSDSDEEWA
ncbi:MAG: hypothetical protein KC418_23495 [Anaerolineales bacterium]|nr:hypothetical protein [Anaerolineales bacterium]